jgi:hypothetical protein
MKAFFPYLFIFSILLFSCGEKEDDNKYDTSILTSTTWVEKTSYEYNGSWLSATDFIYVEYKFNSDGTGIKTIITPTLTEGITIGDVTFKDFEPINSTTDFKWKLSSKGILTVTDAVSGETNSWELTDYSTTLINTKPMEGTFEIPILSKWSSTAKAEKQMTVFEKKK